MASETSDFSYEEVVVDEAESLRKNNLFFKNGAIRVHPGSWLAAAHFSKIAEEMKNYPVDEDDINIVTFPKSGTTWMQEIVWTLICNPNGDNPLQHSSTDIRVPQPEVDCSLQCLSFWEISWREVPWKFSDIPRFLYLALFKRDSFYFHVTMQMPKPRMFKYHIPLSFFSDDFLNKTKIVYVMRDARDVILSLYHFVRLNKLFGYKDTFDDFIDDFINDRVFYAPYWEHIKQAWIRRHQPNIMLICYEDLKSDPVSQLQKLDKFLGTNLKPNQLKQIAEFTSFDQMKSRMSDKPPTSNYNSLFNEDIVKKEGGFFRKGIVGDWKNKFTEKQLDKIHPWMSEHLKDFGEEFPYKV